MIEHQLWLGRRAAVVALHMVGERLRPPAPAAAADVPRNGTDLNVDWQRGAPARDPPSGNSPWGTVHA